MVNLWKLANSKETPGITAPRNHICWSRHSARNSAWVVSCDFAPHCNCWPPLRAVRAQAMWSQHQHSQKQALRAPDIPYPALTCPRRLLFCFACTGRALPDTPTQPAAANGPVTRPGGHLPKMTPLRPSPHSTQMTPPLAPWRHTMRLGRSVPEKSCSYDPCQPSLGGPDGAFSGDCTPTNPTPHTNAAAAGNMAPQNMLSPKPLYYIHRPILKEHSSGTP